MNIRLATLDDVFTIHKMSESLNIERDSKKRSGFVEYDLSQEDFRKRIESNPRFYVADDRSEIIGFCACYDEMRLRDGTFSNDPIAKTLLSKNRPLVYVDQLGVIRPGTFASQVLLDYALRESAEFWCAIVNYPHKNYLATNLAVRNGFRIEEKITHDGLVFDLFRRELRG